EVDPAADDPGRDAPQRDVADDVRVAADGAPPAPGDDDRRGDADQVRQGVKVYDQRADVEAVDRRAGNVRRGGHGHIAEITRPGPDRARGVTPGPVRPLSNWNRDRRRRRTRPHAGPPWSRRVPAGGW